MTILQIAILASLAVVIGRLRWGRQLAMLALSAFAVFWLQPAEPFPSLQYWLPLGTLVITAISWALTSKPEARSFAQNWPAVAVLVAVSLLADLNRYLRLGVVYFKGAPLVQLLLLTVVAVIAAVFLLLRWQRGQRYWQIITLTGILLVFMVLKSPVLQRELLAMVERMRGGQADINFTALSWLGFSYLAFRLIHTIRDSQSGRLPSVTLAEYVNYVIFFPSFTAGPIDRIERFLKELRLPLALGNDDWVDAGTRLFVGLFKKFVIADLLAVISINNTLVAQVKSSAWMWVFLYAYAFRIYFDFSGYTDIAIGMGRLMGIRLPENFAAPYLKPNLTQFWNSWHISLTQWFRAYFFNPLTRALRSTRRPMPIWTVILVAQLSTMVLIGLWHGVTWGFAAWGAWHGIGLFVNNRWDEFIGPRIPAWSRGPRGQLATNALGVFITFHYVAVGWLFFSLATPGVAWQALLKLFGAG